MILTCQRYKKNHHRVTKSRHGGRQSYFNTKSSIFKLEICMQKDLYLLNFNLDQKFIKILNQMVKNELKINHNYQTLIGEYAKIRIRPVIDGRMRGVRESLEDQTMSMAKNAAKLIALNLKYPNGKPVESVIADTCIGGVAEAAMCAEKFSKNGVGVSLTVTPCWCYGSETIDMKSDIPKAIWGFNGTERPGAVYLAAALAGHTMKGLPAFG